MGKMQMTDPYTFFVDMGLSDPEGRTEKLILAKTDPMAYLQKVSKKLDSSQALAQALMNVEQTGAAMPQTSSSAAGPVSPAQPTMPQQGQPPMAPVQGPSPMNTIAIPQTSTGPPQGSPRIL
jgi:hypothetical protein